MQLAMVHGDEGDVNGNQPSPSSVELGGSATPAEKVINKKVRLGAHI